MEYLAENIRYLLWRHQPDRSRWVETVMQCLGCDRQAAKTLLNTGEIDRDGVGHLARIFSVPSDRLYHVRLIEQDGIDIAKQNVLYLIGRLPYGRKQQLAAYLKIHPANISKWVNGEGRVTTRHIGALCRFCGVPSPEDFTTKPLFLSPVPFTCDEQKAWLHERIEHFDSAVLRERFPALQVLLDE